MWTCPVCDRTFKRKNQSHFCKTVHTVDEFIAQQPESERMMLTELRQLIKDVAPEAEETIRWGMPTFIQGRNIAHFSVHTNHVGLHVGASTVEHFNDELQDIRFAKGTIHLSKTSPLP